MLFRKVPKVPGIIEHCRRIPGLLGLFGGRVPAEFIFQASEQEVDVSCPCGNAPHVPFNVVVPCDRRQLADPPEREVCDRWFFYDGTDVRVARQLAYLA